ncbi:MAG: hypothetical protein HOU81_15825 [Hamadaea sp.]|uniref:hypothetical protein n=1 Tax=Hamadaea sp. TaxID=2024425 RepID=UPI0018484B82|nr:hypothetical protein [Hamadaea sp.]NUR72282.1 hypothetical protein [Hamadaea sp.]NUT23238.1 hypothetical protein [Hamadaea sp.]
MIIPRETMKRLYGVGGDLSRLPVGPESIDQLNRLVAAAATLTSRVSVTELDEAYAALLQSPETVDEADQIVDATERELTKLWAGTASQRAAVDLTGARARLARIRAASLATTTALEKLDSQVAEVDGVIRQGSQHLAEAGRLLPAVASAAGQYGDRVQFEQLFEQARTAAVNGAALVFQAYRRFDEVCASAKGTLEKIAREVGNPDVVTASP